MRHADSVAKKQPKALAKQRSPASVSRELLRREVLWCSIAGLRMHDMPAELDRRGFIVSAADARLLLDEALAELQVENAALARSVLNIRLARLDHFIAKAMPDVNDENKAVSYNAMKHVLEIERERSRLILGARQVDSIDRELERGKVPEGDQTIEIKWVDE